MESKNTFYQLRLFRKGEIEIFQNVFKHRLHVENNEPKGIEVIWSRSKNPGLCTHSMRPYDGIYDVQLIDDPIYCPNFLNSKPKNTTITIH